MDLTRVKRSTAFAVHFGFSLCVFLILAALMVTNWYPGPYFTVDGGWQGIRIIAFVDLVLGPALTLMFFRPARKQHRELKLDLSIIATVQLVALTWGTWTIYQQRVVATVFVEDEFMTVSHAGLQQARANLTAAGMTPKVPDQLSGESPPLVYVRPFAQDEIGDYLGAILGGLPEAAERADRYQALPFDDAGFSAHEITPETIEKAYPQAAQRLREVLSSSERPLQAYRIRTRFKRAVAVIDPREGGRLVDIISYRDRL